MEKSGQNLLCRDVGVGPVVVYEAELKIAVKRFVALNISRAIVANEGYISKDISQRIGKLLITIANDGLEELLAALKAIGNDKGVIVNG